MPTYEIPRGLAKNRVPGDNHKQGGSVDGDDEAQKGGGS